MINWFRLFRRRSKPVVDLPDAGDTIAAMFYADAERQRREHERQRPK
jgi:hypothetical protein